MDPQGLHLAASSAWPLRRSENPFFLARRARSRADLSAAFHNQRKFKSLTSDYIKTCLCEMCEMALRFLVVLCSGSRRKAAR